MHDTWPASGWKVPTGHGVAAVAPAGSTNEPAGAGGQGSSPGGEKKPAGHGVAASAGSPAVASTIAKANPATVRPIVVRRRACSRLVAVLAPAPLPSISCPFGGFPARAATLEVRSASASITPAGA